MERSVNGVEVQSVSPLTTHTKRVTRILLILICISLVALFFVIAATMPYTKGSFFVQLAGLSICALVATVAIVVTSLNTQRLWKRERGPRKNSRRQEANMLKRRG